MKIILQEYERLDIVTPLGTLNIHVRHAEKIVITDARPEVYRNEKIPLDAVLEKNGWRLR